MRAFKIFVLLALMVLVFYIIGLDEVFFKTGSVHLYEPSVTEWLQDYESEQRFQESQNRVLSMINR